MFPFMMWGSRYLVEDSQCFIFLIDLAKSLLSESLLLLNFTHPVMVTVVTNNSSWVTHYLKDR